MTHRHKKEKLHFAAKDGDVARVKELVESGYDVNAFDSFSYTPLHHAVKGGHIEVVECLLSVGGDVNAHEQEKIGQTPLGEVAANCSYEMAEVLVKAGANPTIPGWMALTALDHASARKREEGRRVYELLLSTAKKKYHHEA